MTLLATNASPTVATSARPRRIVHRTRGARHGPITRLVSPSGLGELIKPFVFLDHIDVGPNELPRFGFHPHSGIATLTLLLEGGFAYEDSTGQKGTMDPGAVEWMNAGGGVWHAGHGLGQRIEGYQLWIALPPALENGPALSQYLSGDRFPVHGPARVILGDLGGARSPIRAPSPVNVLDVRLGPGELWRYDPPRGHDVAWIAVHEGAVRVPQSVCAGELAVFEESQAAITFRAEGDTSLVLGSAVRHPHELVLGDYSVHTTHDALVRGESTIRRIARELPQMDG